MMRALLYLVLMSALLPVAAAGNIPPEADITSPDWFTQVDPARPGFNLDGVSGVRPFSRPGIARR